MASDYQAASGNLLQSLYFPLFRYRIETPERYILAFCKLSGVIIVRDASLIAAHGQILDNNKCS
jgi:hypothetical protein